MTLIGTVICLGPVHIVLDGDPACAAAFRPMSLWPNGWIDQVPLDTEVGLSPGDIVLDVDPAPTTERDTAVSTPTFRPICLLWPNGRPYQQLLNFCF